MELVAFELLPGRSRRDAGASLEPGMPRAPLRAKPGRGGWRGARFEENIDLHRRDLHDDDLRGHSAHV